MKKVYLEEDILKIADEQKRATYLENEASEKTDAEFVKKYKFRQNKRFRETSGENVQSVPSNSEETVMFSMVGNGILFFFKTGAAVNVSRDKCRVDLEH